jgi:hypothetical protein
VHLLVDPTKKEKHQDIIDYFGYNKEEVEKIKEWV